LHWTNIKQNCSGRHQWWALLIIFSSPWRWRQ